MFNKSIIPILIIIFSLLIIFYILNEKRNNIYKHHVQKFIHYNENNKYNKFNKWIVLLTTCVSPRIKSNEFINENDEMEYRKELYVQQINNWLDKTDLYIVVVECSGYTFPEINKNNERLKIISFNLDKNNSSNSSDCEVNSMKYALNKLKTNENYKNCTHILKVTGRYYLENINSVLKNTSPNLDLYLQYHRQDDIKWQNTEYYGIKKELCINFIKSYNYSQKIENYLYEYSLDKKYTMIGKFPNNIKRDEDNLLIKEL